MINFSASQGGASGVVVSLKGFNQTTQPDSTAQSSDHVFCSNPETDNISVGTSNSWIFDTAIAGSGFGSPSSGQTQLGTSITSYKSNVSVGTSSMGWTYTSCNAGSHAIASFSPAPPVQGITFTYDALNRVTLKDLPNAETDVTYQYDTAPTSFSGYFLLRTNRVLDRKTL